MAFPGHQREIHSTDLRQLTDFPEIEADENGLCNQDCDLPVNSLIGIAGDLRVR